MVLVGDRGMVTGANLEQLRSDGHGYIVGRNRRRSGEIFDYIQSATGSWIECPVGNAASEKSPRRRFNRASQEDLELYADLRAERNPGTT